MSFSIIFISRSYRPGNIRYSCIISNLYLKSYKISQLFNFTGAFSTIKQCFFQPHRKDRFTIWSCKTDEPHSPESKANPLEVEIDICASIWKRFLTRILCFLISTKKSPINCLYSRTWYSKCNCYFHSSQWWIPKKEPASYTCQLHVCYSECLYNLSLVEDLSIFAQQLYFTNCLLKKNNQFWEVKYILTNF